MFRVLLLSSFLFYIEVPPHVLGEALQTQGGTRNRTFRYLKTLNPEPLTES